MRVALPADVLSNIPADLAPYFEKRENIEGELEVIAECEENDGRILYYLNNDKERLSLRFAKPPDEELLNGAHISVKGIRVGDVIAVNFQENTSNSQILNAPLPNTFGEQKVLVLLVNFQNNQTQPFTVAQVNDMIFGTVNDYYRETSFGRTWLTGNTFGYFTLPMNSGDCAGGTLASNARQAAQNSGVNLSVYNRFIYVFPTMNCGYSGQATLGGNETWINGTLTSQNIAHELGHNFGLHHARYLDCGTEVVGNNCTSTEYGHIMDTVGGGRGHFHAFHKERLGWLNFADLPLITTVTQSGNYSIAPLATLTGTSPKALKILKSVDSSGRKTWYYIELRRNFGFDSGISNNANLMNGVMINLNQESNPQENYMLDMTPETTTRSDPALTLNRTYTDAAAGFSITPLSAGDNGATVNINFGTAVCQPANPTVSINPTATQWLGAGGSISYTLTVTNNNSAGCANNNFTLQGTLPSGWNAVFASPTLNINSGASATTTVQITAPTTASDNFYSLVFSAVNVVSPAYRGSVTASCAVYSSLGVAASPGQTSYTRSQTAVVRAIVTANGAAIAGASITFTMTKSNGSVVQSYAVTSTDGSAIFSYQFNRKRDPTGIYTVSVSANLNGVSGNGSTNFEVR